MADGRWEMGGISKIGDRRSEMGDRAEGAAGRWRLLDGDLRRSKIGDGRSFGRGQRGGGSCWVLDGDLRRSKIADGRSIRGRAMPNVGAGDFLRSGDPPSSGGGYGEADAEAMADGGRWQMGGDGRWGAMADGGRWQMGGDGRWGAGIGLCRPSGTRWNWRPLNPGLKAWASLVWKGAERPEIRGFCERRCLRIAPEKRIKLGA